MFQLLFSQDNGPRSTLLTLALMLPNHSTANNETITHIHTRLLLLSAPLDTPLHYWMGYERE
jgi:hypothetical protein